jgi:hypothetical protein
MLATLLKNAEEKILVTLPKNVDKNVGTTSEKCLREKKSWQHFR